MTYQVSRRVRATEILERVHAQAEIRPAVGGKLRRRGALHWARVGLHVRGDQHLGLEQQTAAARLF